MCLVKKVFKLSIVPYQTEIIVLQKYIAAVHLHSDEKIYLKISQNFQENTCAGVFFKQSSGEGLKKKTAAVKKAQIVLNIMINSLKDASFSTFPF